MSARKKFNEFVRYKCLKGSDSEKLYYSFMNSSKNVSEPVPHNEQSLIYELSQESETLFLDGNIEQSRSCELYANLIKNFIMYEEMQESSREAGLQ